MMRCIYQLQKGAVILKCTFTELRSREVINTSTGARIGYIDDLEIDMQTGRISSLIICGRPRLMGILGKDDDIVINCDDIEKIGSDTVLVKESGIEEEMCKTNKNRNINLFD